MIQVSPAAREELAQIKQLYLLSFPKEERKPFWLIRGKTKQGTMEILSVKQENDFSGLAITVLHKDLLLLDYFAIAPQVRGKGIGSQVLEALQQRYHDKRLFLEIEQPVEDAPNLEQRIKRKQFYLRNGFTESGLKVDLFGVKMEILCCQCEITEEEYLSLYRSFLGHAAVKKNIRMLP